MRWDGGHKRDAFLSDVLAPFVEWVPVCPEVEAGLGVPREAIRFEEEGGRVLLVGEGSGRDHTATLERFARVRLKELGRLGLDGYVFKQDSPSCGVHPVKVYSAGHEPKRKGRGLFAAALTRAWPNLPVEEEGRLADPVLRESFVERVFAWQRLRNTWTPRFSVARLEACHAAHRLQLMAHDEAGCRSLDECVSGAARGATQALRTRYVDQFAKTMARPATRRSQNHILHHAADRLKPHLTRADRHELGAEIDAHRRGLVPLIGPVTLIRHHARVHQVADLSGQTFLEPHPHEWMLRNHV